MKRKTSALLIVLILSLIFGESSNGQNYYDFVKPDLPSRWSIGGMVSPDYEGQFFKALKDPDKDFSKALKSHMKYNEHAGFGYTAGVHVLYDINNRWFARFGIYYAEKTIRSNGNTIATYPDSTVFFDKSLEFQSMFSFIDMPLTFHYMLNKPYDKNKEGTCYTSYSQYNRKKPLFYLFFGPAYSLNTSEYDYYSRRWTTSTDTALIHAQQLYVDRFAVNYLGLNAGVGYLKYFNKNVFFTVEPVFRMFPVRWYSKKYRESEEPANRPHSLKAGTYTVRDMPWSIGLQLAINYHFK